MKVAFTTQDDRIAPVFDTAGHLLLLVVDQGSIQSESTEILAEGSPQSRATRLVELGVEVLVCGAISAPFCQCLTAQQMEVIGFVAGNCKTVVKAWIEGSLCSDAYRMPGCRRPFRRGQTTCDQDADVHPRLCEGAGGRRNRRGRDRHGNVPN